MKAELTDWTIVLAGAWNAAIFTPDWVSRNVFDAPLVGVEMQLGAPIPVLKYTHGRMMLIIRPDQLVGAPQDTSEEAMDQVTTALCNVLRQLSHTPILATGINFGFRETDPSQALLANFAMDDNAKLIDLGGRLAQTSVQRELVLDESILRLRETVEESGNVHFHFNFHFESLGAAATADLLVEKGQQKRTRALEMMKTVYDLEPETPNA